MAIRVFVIDDSDVFRDAVREVLEATAEFELVGEAHSGEDAIADLAATPADVVLIDILLPGIDGLETCRRVREDRPDQFVMLCSVATDPRLTDPGLGCPDVTFLPKARISPRALRAAWDARAVGVTS